MSLTRLMPVVLAAAAALTSLNAQQVPELRVEHFDKLHKLLSPGPHESHWMTVPWMPSSDIYAARKKAAAEGKPLLLWYMAGEPLGTC
jgi:hypothetical protein